MKAAVIFAAFACLASLAAAQYPAIPTIEVGGAVIEDADKVSQDKSAGSI